LWGSIVRRTALFSTKDILGLNYADIHAIIEMQPSMPFMSYKIKQTAAVRAELSQAVRDLRKALGATQQEFALRVPTAVRTIARWENGHPPHGKALVRLAQLAEAQGIEEIAGMFVRTLQLEMTNHDVTAQPELKGWLDGVEVAFRHRYRLGERWTTLGEKIIEAVNFAAAAANEISSPEGPEFEDLSRQLRGRLKAHQGED
jgi:transcriptional regulator with XRE-family HTH domain